MKKSLIRTSFLLLVLLIGASTSWAQKLPATARLADKKEYAGIELYLNVERAASEDDPAAVVSLWLLNTNTGRAVRVLTTNPMAQGRWSEMSGHKSVNTPLTQIAAAEKALFVAGETDLILLEGCPDARNVWSYLVDLKTRTAKQLPTNSGLICFIDEGPFILMNNYRYDYEGETGRYNVIQAFRPDGSFVGELPLGPVEE
jgi:hypothetical protein